MTFATRASLPLVLPVLLLPALLPAQFPRSRDSAGVHIVENSARAKAPIAFRLSEKPTFDIGGLKTNPEDELSPNGGYLRSIVLSNGTYVVGDDSRLRFFDASGKQLRVAGRSGQGPGEFRQISTICRTRGDTIVVSDPGNARVTVFDKAGTIVKQVPVGRAELPFDGCFDDGTWVVMQSGMAADSSRLTKLVRYSNDGTAAGNAGEYWGGKFDMFVNLYPAMNVRGTRVYFGDPRTSEVRLYDRAGKLTGIIRTEDPVLQTTAAEKDAMLPTAVPATNDQAILDRFKERLRSTPRPASWPSYGRIHVDPDGRLWIEDYRKVRSTDPDVWTAFDASGKMLGRLSMPARIKRGDPNVVDFTSGGVLVRREDDDGAPHLTTYALIPVPGARR